MCLGFVTTYFLAHTLTQENFGEYHLILSVVGILSMFALRGLNNSIMQSTARGFKGTYRVAVPIAFLSSLIGAFILVLLSIYYMNQNPTLALGFLISGLFFPFMHGMIHWKGVETGKEKFKKLVIFESISAFIMHAGIIITLMFFTDTFLLPLTILFLIPSLFNIALTFYKMREIPINEAQESASIKYGIKSTMFESFNILAKHTDKILLFFWLSPTTLALFVAADRIAELVRNTTQDIAAVLAPRFAKNKEYTQTLDKALKLFSLLIGIAIIIFAFTILPYLIEIIFGDKYIPSIPYSQALLCTVALGNLAILRFRFIRSQLDLDNFRNIIVFTSLFRILCSSIFIPLWGLNGAILSVLLYRGFMIIVVGRVMKEKYMTNWS